MGKCATHTLRNLSLGVPVLPTRPIWTHTYCKLSLLLPGAILTSRRDGPGRRLGHWLYLAHRKSILPDGPLTGDFPIPDAGYLWSWAHLGPLYRVGYSLFCSQVMSKEQSGLSVKCFCYIIVIILYCLIYSNMSSKAFIL